MLYSAIAALYVVGLLGLHSMSTDFSTSDRTWATRLALVFWPVSITLGLVMDLVDYARGDGAPTWLKF